MTHLKPQAPPQYENWNLWCFDTVAGHDKVWQAEVGETPSGTAFFARRWGRRGGPLEGMTQLFESFGEAMAAALKLVGQKTKAGRRSGTYRPQAVQLDMAEVR